MTTWTPKTQQAETWTAEAAPNLSRTFSPFTFSRRPVFDTGATSLIWEEKTKQAETWTVES